jgi:hypothetical protein
MWSTEPGCYDAVLDLLFEAGGGVRHTAASVRAVGKPPRLAFIALARKLLTILTAMVRDQTE